MLESLYLTIIGLGFLLLLTTFLLKEDNNALNHIFLPGMAALLLLWASMASFDIDVVSCGPNQIVTSGDTSTLTNECTSKNIRDRATGTILGYFHFFAWIILFIKVLFYGPEIIEAVKGMGWIKRAMKKGGR